MELVKQNKIAPYYGFILVALGAIFYLPFLGSVHLFDWDEINFAESSREMLVTGNYFRVTVDYQPFWEKPPLFFWFQAACMKIFGINEMAARMPNALFGILTLLTLYRTGKRIKNEQFGFIWAFIYFISFLPFFYFKSGIIDPIFNYFIFTSLLFFIRATQTPEAKRSISFALIAGLLNGLAILTKGPVGLLIVLLSFLVIWLVSKFKVGISIRIILLFLIGGALSSSLWYLPELINNGPWFLQEFITYQIELFTKPVAGHQQPFYYHFIVVFIGCFPLSVFALPELFKIKRDGFLFEYKKWMLVLFWVVMILFTIVSTKIVHYSSMAYLPLSFLAALSIATSIEQNKSVGQVRIILLGIIGTIFSIALLALPFFFIYKDHFIQYIKDPFAIATIQQDQYWSGFEYLFGLSFLFGIVLLLVFLVKKRTFKGIVLYGILSVSILLFYLKTVVPKVEKYVQGDLIEFYISMQGKDVYMAPTGFKTYANLFYFRQPYRVREPNQEKYINDLMAGPIDKPVYFVVKNTEKYVKELPDVKLVNTFGGYLIYKREPTF